MDHLQTMSVHVDTAQPLWITVTTTADTPAGTYYGNVTLSLPIPNKPHAPAWVASHPLTVIVRDLTLPAEREVLTLWGTELTEWDGADTNREGSTGSTDCNDAG
jgi:hypothetical protein